MKKFIQKRFIVFAIMFSFLVSNAYHYESALAADIQIEAATRNDPNINPGDPVQFTDLPIIFSFNVISGSSPTCELIFIDSGAVVSGPDNCGNGNRGSKTYEQSDFTSGNGNYQFRVTNGLDSGHFDFTLAGTTSSGASGGTGGISDTPTAPNVLSLIKNAPNNPPWKSCDTSSKAQQTRGVRLLMWL